MTMTDTDERRSALDAFAAGNTAVPSLAPGVRPLAAPADRVFGAQQVAVYRDEAKILSKIKTLAAAAGDAWYYRFPIKNKRAGTTDWVEGASIKLANDVARIYGNCDVDVRVIDLGDSWVLYARFSDFETGYSLTRPFQQRKGQATMGGGDGGRALDIAFQIGVSKAVRNVVVNALQTFADFAFDEAKNSLVDKIGKELPRWRERTLKGISNMEIDLKRVEAVIGRASNDWLAPDIARVIAMGKAINDGMATIDETFPTLGAKAETPSTQETSTLPASGQGAPDIQPPPPTESGAPEASPEIAGSTAAAAGKPAAKEKPAAAPAGMRTEAEYIAHANAWLEGVENADLLEQQWTFEKSMRNRANVTATVRQELVKKIEEKAAKLRGQA